jgi:hypothetical protein
MTAHARRGYGTGAGFAGSLAPSPQDRGTLRSAHDQNITLWKRYPKGDTGNLMLQDEFHVAPVRVISESPSLATYHRARAVVGESSQLELTGLAGHRRRVVQLVSIGRHDCRGDAPWV